MGKLVNKIKYQTSNHHGHLYNRIQNISPKLQGTRPSRPVSGGPVAAGPKGCMKVVGRVLKCSCKMSCSRFWIPVPWWSHFPCVFPQSRVMSSGSIGKWHKLGYAVHVGQLIHRLMWANISYTINKKRPNLCNFPLPGPQAISVPTFLLELLRGASGQSALGAAHVRTRVELLAAWIGTTPSRGWNRNVNKGYF